MLVNDHLDMFLESPAYRQLVRSGRSSLLILAKTLVSSSSAGSESTVNSPTNQSIKELKHFMLSQHNFIFGSFLQKHGEINLMYFCQSALRFKDSQFPSDIDRVTEAASIFERYLSRNAVDHVTLSDDVRRKIVQNLFSAPQVD